MTSIPEKAIEKIIEDKLNLKNSLKYKYKNRTLLQTKNRPVNSKNMN